MPTALQFPPRVVYRHPSKGAMPPWQISPFHFSRVFKQTTGRVRCNSSPASITRAQQMMRETNRTLIEIALEVGHTRPSVSAQVFRRVVGVTPTEFRSAL